jgi:hypothetical protein
VSTIYERAHEFLDTDERMITRDIYEVTPWLYDEVRGTVALYRNEIHGHIDWVFDNRTRVAFSEEWLYLGEYIIVRVRSESVKEVDLISPSELQKNRGMYVVLDIYFKLCPKAPPFKSLIVRAISVPIDMHRYDRIGIMYQVRYKSFEDIK